MQRRTFIGAALSGVTALAGCGSVPQGSSPPTVPRHRLAEAGWARNRALVTEAFERPNGVDANATASTVRYRHQKLREQVSDRTMAQVDAPFGRFFATRLRVDPAVETLGPAEREAYLATAKQAVTDQFLAWLSSDGVTDLERTVEDVGFDVATGETASRTAFSAALPLHDVPIAAPGGEALTIDPGTVAVEGHVAVWIHDGDIYAAGGSYPAENVDETESAPLSGGMSMTVHVDFGFDPATYRTELFDLMRHVR